MEIKVTNCGDCIFLRRYIMPSIVKGYCRLLKEVHYIKELQTILPNCPLKQGEITVKLEEI